MHARLGFLLIAFLVTAAGSSTAFSQSSSQTGLFTLQVASFPTKQLADQLMIDLVEAGEHPICATVASKVAVIGPECLLDCSRRANRLADTASG